MRAKIKKYIRESYFRKAENRFLNLEYTSNDMLFTWFY